MPAYGKTAVLGDVGLALDYDAKTLRTSRAELGPRQNQTKEMISGTHRMTASLALAHHFNTGRSATAGFSALVGTSFDVAGAD